jgi:hypothetical protein
MLLSKVTLSSLIKHCRNRDPWKVPQNERSITSAPMEHPLTCQAQGSRNRASFAILLKQPILARFTNMRMDRGGCDAHLAKLAMLLCKVTLT